MLAESFNPSEVLKAVKCQRCHAKGLEVIDYDTFEAAHVVEGSKRLARQTRARPLDAPACGLVMECGRCVLRRESRDFTVGDRVGAGEGFSGPSGSRGARKFPPENSVFTDAPTSYFNSMPG